MEIDKIIIDGLLNILKSEILNDKKETKFVTVGEGEGQHVIPVEYMEKGKKKEEKKVENPIKVEKETKKAYLLNKDNVKFWVQKRWYKDGKLTPAGEKSYNEAKEILKEKEENKTKTVKFQSSWESEKAYGVDIPFDMYDLEKTVTMRVFIPKSMVKNGEVPYWLYQKKMKEAYEKMTEKYEGHFGGFTHMDGGFELENSLNEIYYISEDGNIELFKEI